MSNQDWLSAAQDYLARVGEAEYAAFTKRRNPKKSDRFHPSEYMRTLCSMLGDRDCTEEDWKAYKMEQGRNSTLGF